MKLYNWLNERNILNLNDIDSFLKDISRRTNNNYVQKWIHSTFKRWLINQYSNVELVKNYSSSMPSWAEKAIKTGELFLIKLEDRVFKDQVLHVIDYLNTYNNPIKFDYLMAIQKAEEYFNQLKKKASNDFDESGIEIIKKYSNGFYWAKITSEHELQREGKIMNHCVGSYWAQVKSDKISILSLRDLKNIPHCTVEYRGKDINQIKGNSNGVVKKEYVPYVEDLLKGKVIKINNIDGNDLLKIGLIYDIKGDLYSIDKIKTEIVVNDLNLSEMNLEKLPDLSKVIVNGDFYCFGNKLITLKGAPKEVRGNFYCDNNKLTSLEGAPREVGRDFICSSNNLTSLKGAPKEVGRDFICAGNQLISLEGAPKIINGDFSIFQNKLTSLDGALEKILGEFDFTLNKIKLLKNSPKKIGGNFLCSYNELISLEGMLKEIFGSFICSFNKLKSLKGAPLKIQNSFIVKSNNLISLDGCPKEVGGDFEGQFNYTKFTKEDVKKVCNVSGNIIV